MSKKERKAKLFSSTAYNGPTREVEIEGVTLEIRPAKVKHSLKGIGDPSTPTTAQPTDLDDLFLNCVYDAESGEPMFERSDLETLGESAGHDSGLVGQILKEIKLLDGEMPGKAEKN